MHISRREFLACASALLLARPASGQPARLARKDCYFGLHFDFDPNGSDTDIGRDLTDDMVAHLLDTCRPDFVECDSKGHFGYLCYPSKTGMSAPGIVQDPMAIWRRVTAAHGVALYNHFSGLRDIYAINKHPDWARIGPDGKPDPQQVSLFAPYEQELMISELTEVAVKYDLDGSWVDSDCWAAQSDYSNAAKSKFFDLTGNNTLPRKPDEKDWDVFMEMQRDAFRQYVARYVDALHKAKPGIQITSNFMYTTFAPEPPTLPLDFLSADLSAECALRQARLQARYLSSSTLPWDLMSWGFELDALYKSPSNKPAVQLEQEAAVVIAQGGAYQVYYIPTRSGWIDDHIVNTAAEVGKFCRQRQHWSQHSQTLQEVGLLYSSRTIYRTGLNPFGAWGEGETPVDGAMDLLLSMGYSVDLIPDWQLALRAAEYPLIVAPDWIDMGNEVISILANYVSGGGKLLLCGADNARLFSSILNLRFSSPQQFRTYGTVGDSGFAEVPGSWIDLKAEPQQVIANAYRDVDSRKGSVPLAMLINHGKGTVIVCPGPIGSSYAKSHDPILRAAMRDIVHRLHLPIVAFDTEDQNLEVVLRIRSDQTLIHLINTDGSINASREFHHPGVVRPTGPIHLRLRLPHAPSHVYLEPDGTPLIGKYEAGEWRGVVPDLHVHSILRIPEII